ncbi:MAG: FKBP-type peptidyl-prolyl cis-trans isomerase [Chitinophagales bacterium]|nr:FKBP-type peptidyl-prolyl cis-trans isomerase [Chitinophagales bacterium]
MKKLLIYLGFLSALFSCKKEDQATIDENIIKQYISDNSLNASRTESGVYYVIADTGIGVNPAINSTVKVYYAGYLTNGNVFDNTTPGSPATFNLGLTIQGWKDGLPKIKEGGKIKLIIPSALGYGSQSYGSIPKNSVLVFDIELLDVL